jgi:predicted oxidoreductase
MQFQQLGNSNIEVSSIAWGMWRFEGNDVELARRLIEAVLATGITLFDTADIYGTVDGQNFGSAEALFGKVLARAPELRRLMVLATKAGIYPGVPYDSSAKYLSSALEASLRRLRTDVVDLWQIHRPDILAHPQEVARALEDAHAAGKVKAIGVSNFTPSQTAVLAHFCRVPLVSQQLEFSPLTHEPALNGLFDQAMTMGLTVLAWSPIAGGRLANPQNDRARAVAKLLDCKATEASVDRAAAALSWIMTHPSRPIPIVGTQNFGRIATIPDALRLTWSRAEWYQVFEASLGEKLP